jgi:peptidase E
MNAVIESGFNKVLLNLLDNIVYVGTSAGSMICSKSLDASEWYIGEPELNSKNLEGLGYIDFQIYPHFEDINLEKIRSAVHKDQKYWLLKNGQAVAINNKDIKVCGGDIIKL